MKLSSLFTHTFKNTSADLESRNAQLLTRAGFIRQELAGVYSYLPLGLRVLNKIEEIVRSEMDKIGNEVLMPALSPKENWKTTGRLDTVDVLFQASGANDESRRKNSGEYVLNSTHEETITPLVKSFASSYRDLPTAVYQIQTKFRNEPRAKSGLLRGREFRMKDMYSFHASEKDLLEFYERVKGHYMNIFRAVGIGEDTFVTFASGGDFTSEYSHEFQTLLAEGEDTIYLDREKRVAYNKEIATPEDAKKLGVNFSGLETARASEVGNIFPLNTKFSKAFDYCYTNEKGERKLVYMGCYGLGTSRLMGVLAEKFSDDKGLVWPKSVAPYRAHLIALDGAKAEADKLYDEILKTQIEILYDDRDKTAGEKFADADLIGIPIRLVVSKKTLEQKSVEMKKRSETETKLIPISGVVDLLS